MKMKMPSVSIIIPIYNVEKYIRRCVNSALSQTCLQAEIILVDDGSPDKCPAICNEYAEKYTEIKVVHKENGGLASARNAGLAVAEGKYIFFLDSDDWIEPNTVEELIKIAEEKQVDFVRFRPMHAGWPNHQDGDLCDFGTEQGMQEGLYDKGRIEKEIFPRLIATPQLTMGVIVAAWRSLYRRAFLIQNGLLFDENVRYSEDSIFSAKVVWKANSFYYLDGPRYYHYFYNPSSITKSFRKDRWDSCKNLIACFENTFGDNAVYDFFEQLQLQKIFSVIHALGQRTVINDMKQREKYCREICFDPVCIQAMKYLKLVKVSWKLKGILLLIKYKQYRVLARI